MGFITILYSLNPAKMAIRMRQPKTNKMILLAVLRFFSEAFNTSFIVFGVDQLMEKGVDVSIRCFDPVFSSFTAVESKFLEQMKAFDVRFVD